MAPVIPMKSLLEAGVHFGHRAKKWNPKMKPYIFTERNGIHILDLQQTLSSLEEAYALVRDTVARGGVVLFVGTKRQAQETVQQEADRAEMPYVSERWLAGTLTNWVTIKDRIEALKRFERERDEGLDTMLTKKERLIRSRIIDKLQVRLGGLRNMVRRPELIFLVDVRREYLAVQEANTMNIPILALVDTNCDPDHIDYVIPANDDAIRAIKLLTGRIADAALEGMAMRKATIDDDAAGPQSMSEADLARYEKDLDNGSDEAYLGADTLAKLRDLNFDDEDEAKTVKR